MGCETKSCPYFSNIVLVKQKQELFIILKKNSKWSLRNFVELEEFIKGLITAF
jgi:hypothetical protein